MELNNYILEQARKSEICEPWALRIKAANNTDDLMKMYVKGIDFCLANDFPSNDDLISLVGPDKLEQYGIYVDGATAILNEPFIVLLGSTIGHVKWDGFSVGQCFIKNDSKAVIHVAGHAFVVVDAFDHSYVEITATDTAKVLVNLYGDAEISDQTTGDAIIKIIHKHKTTY